MQRIVQLALFLVAFGSGQPLHAQARTLSAAPAPPVVVRKTAGLSPDTYKGRQVMVGSGGGFTGASVTYYLLDSGRLYGRRSRDTTYVFIGRQTAANTKRVFSVIEKKCRIKTTRFDDPGNVYKFVGWRKGRQQFKVTWGGAGKNPPAVYPKFYDSFMAMIPASARLK